MNKDFSSNGKDDKGRRSKNRRNKKRPYRSNDSRRRDQSRYDNKRDQSRYDNRRDQKVVREAKDTEKKDFRPQPKESSQPPAPQNGTDNTEELQHGRKFTVKRRVLPGSQQQEEARETSPGSSGGTDTHTDTSQPVGDTGKVNAESGSNQEHPAVNDEKKSETDSTKDYDTNQADIAFGRR
jgi:hypothetical protein